jgi:hypothetical protein
MADREEMAGMEETSAINLRKVIRTTVEDMIENFEDHFKNMVPVDDAIRELKDYAEDRSPLKPSPFTGMDIRISRDLIDEIKQGIDEELIDEE